MSYPIPSWLYPKMLNEPARPDTAELRASAAAAIGRLDAWLATSTPRVEHRAVRCGMCGDIYNTGANPCCLWSAGLLEGRAAQPQQFVMVGDELVEVEFRTGQIISVR